LIAKFSFEIKSMPIGFEMECLSISTLYNRSVFTNKPVLLYRQIEFDKLYMSMHRIWTNSVVVFRDGVFTGCGKSSATRFYKPCFQIPAL
jgi:hypothetical protein